ncbi:hypothetical protein [Virgibacillus halodenitrificans]|uniref:Uncharacterized protein n=1 Tax=Virgibacillus halodenitrificans TaxID=1482 RepID=A0AAC9NJA2_VIRHA|nr:hypothetical protein [Virgibacillus halodenitrificans]APC47317.1 hypothetical protein BME96_03650 [Virgibacillus halodenitrificans]MCG1029671.1 hypothetical protein [Virgibacillus halodenitrificans]CDQ32118.1 hypothetical protein BN993_01522 [Virgibacillus halodenitrificans]
MNTQKVSVLLNKLTIPIQITTEGLEEKRRQGENFYRIHKDKLNWKFEFVEKEKNSKIKILKNFSSETEASKYFYSFQLKRYFFEQYIYPFEQDNKDINIGEPHCSLRDLQEAFNRLNISQSYYSFNGLKKANSILLEPVNVTESKVFFIGEGEKIVVESPVVENWLAYYNTFKKVYKLYLLDKHFEFLLTCNLDAEKLSDEYIKIVLS